MMRLPISPLALGALIFAAGGNLAALTWLGEILSRDAEAIVRAANWTPAGNHARVMTAPIQKPPTAYAESLNRPVFFKARAES